MYEINLIKRRVIPRRMREYIFIGMFCYIAICILMLGLIISTITSELMHMQGVKEQVQKLAVDSSRFYATMDPTFADPDELESHMVNAIKKLEAIKTILSNDRNVPQLLQMLLASVPNGTDLNSCRFQKDTKQLTFEIVVPSTQANKDFNSSKLVSLWKNDEKIMSQVKEIASSKTVRKIERGKEVFVASFICLVYEG